MEFYYSLIDLLWRPKWTLCTTLSLTLISWREGQWQLMPPPPHLFVCLHPNAPPPSPLLPSCPSPKTRLAAVWQADTAGGHSGSQWAERDLWQMGQLSSSDLQSEPLICLLMDGHVQHHKVGVSCRDQQPLHGSPFWPLATSLQPPTSRPRTICKHLAWWWATRSRSLPI